MLRLSSLINPVFTSGVIMNVDRTSTPKYSIAATGITMVEPENVEIRKVESIHDVIQGSACWQSHEVADGAKKRNRFLSTHRTSRIPCEMPDTRPCLTSAPSSSTLEKVLVTDQEDKSARQGWKAARDRQFLAGRRVLTDDISWILRFLMRKKG